jgi:hypothetical protein
VGELYQVAVEHITILDKVEGAPNLFQLEPIEIEGIARPVSAYFFQASASGVPRYPSERWQNQTAGGSS